MKLKTNILVGLLSCFTLMGCDSKVGKDGYAFGQPQYEKTSVVVNVVTYKTYAEFKTAAALRGVTNSSTEGEVAAFTLLQPSKNFDTCTIHMVAPATSYEPEWIGHEFVHCVYGQWHTDNTKRS